MPDKERIFMKKTMVCIFWLCLLTLGLFSSAYAQSDINAGIQFFESKKIPEAKAFFEAFTKTVPSNPEAHYYLGRIYFTEEAYDRAEQSLEQAVKIDAAQSKFHLWLGHVYGRKAQKAGLLNKIGLAKKCREAYEKAVETDPSGLEARNSLLDFYLQAPGIAGGGVDKAIEQADQIKKFNPLAGHQAMARIYTREKKYDLVEQELLGALALEPENRNLNYQLGIAYVEQKKYEKAFEHFESLFAKDPENLNACYQIGRAAVISGQKLDRGMECLQFYLTRNPKEEGLPSAASAHWRLGMIYELKGDVKSAVAEYEQALKIEPGHTQAKDSLKKIRGK
jgi:tetratricopeptide (TPR) repeat protein